MNFVWKITILRQKIKFYPNCGGKLENFWGISCEKSRFYANKSDYFQLRREARKFLGYFVWKITTLRKKIWFFPACGPPLDRPCLGCYVVKRRTDTVRVVLTYGPTSPRLMANWSSLMVSCPRAELLSIDNTMALVATSADSVPSSYL
jgi:hypothetical protein